MAKADRTARSPSGQADVLVLGRVLTLDEAHPRTHALAIRAGRVVALGRGAETLRGPATAVLDCGDRTVLPGFVDAHLHLLALATSALGADCGAATSIAEVLAVVRGVAEKLPPGGWVRASGYREDRLAERRHPTRWELDAVAANHPVRLRHASRHASVLSSLALALAGIDAHTPDPSGGYVERDPTTGEPTGLVVGLDAWLSAHVLPQRRPDELASGIIAASRRLLAAGVTSVHDLTPTNTLATFEQVRCWQRTGALGVRVTLFTGMSTLQERLASGARPGRGDACLTWGGLKLLMAHASGRLEPPLPVVRELVRDAARAGFPVALHAIEVEEVGAAIAAFSSASAVGSAPALAKDVSLRLRRTGRRAPALPWPHRIEHAAVCPPALVERLAICGAAVVTQPGFLYWRGDEYRRAYPRSAWSWLYPAGSFVRAAVPLAAGSDAPVVPPDPLLALRAAVTRRTAADRPLGASQRIPWRHALPLFTRSAAALGGTPDRGHLAPGALADLVVLEGRLADLAAPGRPLPRVALTLLGGDLVFAHPDSAIDVSGVASVVDARRRVDL